MAQLRAQRPVYWYQLDTLASDLLIEEYKQHEVLWKNKIVLLSDAFDAIEKEVKIHIKNTSSEDIKEQLEHLRKKYKDELNKKRKDTNFKPTLWCFDKLSFLDEHINKDQKDTSADDSQLLDSSSTSESNKHDEFGEHVARELRSLANDDLVEKCKTTILQVVNAVKMEYLYKCRYLMLESEKPKISL